MKWQQEKFGTAKVAGHFRIEQQKDGFALKCGWNYIGFFPSEAGAKRVASCIYREAKKTPN